MKIEKDTYYIVRCDHSGVFAGNIARQEGREVELTNVRRIWYWSGAASLSQLSADGVTRPQDCKFTITVPSIVVLDAIEITPCSDIAERSIKGVEEWRV